ncbi:MAG: dihydropteroate synthase [Bacteroidetes bacterium HGW-Bacteroidetes-15]|nr:MAG: dihydropteroate synthase [Bacteroidetes bacterium HGW-Bacteroidetes-15]
MFQPKNTLTFKGKLLNLDTPIVMGIINVTPDSFYRGSQFMFRRRIFKRAKLILQQGGSIIDIGACSTRPGASVVSEEEELRRLGKAVAVIRKHFPEAILSVDTYRASVAKRMVEDFSVNMINDISAGNMDKQMFDTIAKLNVPYIAMHMQGTPQDMQDSPHYNNVIKELFTFFANKTEQLSRLGVKDILIDPGFGFGKTLEHNFTILNNLDAFRILNLPIVVGLSRKSMIYKPLAINPETALNGTTALNTIALIKGAKILRVHDVQEAMETIMLTSLTSKQSIEI